MQLLSPGESWAYSHTMDVSQVNIQTRWKWIKNSHFVGFSKKKKITVWEKILIKLWNLLPWEVLNAEGVPGLLRQLRFLLSVTGEEGLQACIFQWHVLLPCSCGSLVTGCQSAFQSRNYPLISKLLSNEICERNTSSITLYKTPGLSSVGLLIEGKTHSSMNWRQEKYKSYICRVQWPFLLTLPVIK